MPGFFDICSLGKSPELEHKVEQAGKAKARVVTYQTKHLESIRLLEECITQFPAGGEVTFVWVSVKFNGMSMIYWIIKHYGRLSELTVTTFSISKNAIECCFRELDNGNIKKLHFLMSAYKARVSQNDAENLYSLVSSHPNSSYAIADIHAKVTLAKTDSGEYIVICGSGNFADNANIEQYVIINDREVYEFYYSNIHAEGAHTTDG